MESASESKQFVNLSGDPVRNSNKNKIIQIAIDLFSRNGFSAVSIRDITRAAGIKESSLYNHFRGKEELQETIFYNFRLDVARIMPPVEMLDAILDGMTPEAFLKRGYHNFMEHIRDPNMEKIWRVVYLEQCRDPLAREIYLHDIVWQILNFMELVFAKMISLGKVRNHNPGLLAAEYQYPLFAMVTDYLLLRLDGKETTDILARMEGHIGFFIEQNLI